MKFIAKLYPVHPKTSFEVYQLDCLDEQYESTFKSDYDNLTEKEYLNMYSRGVPSLRNSNIRHYNNSTWYVGEADSVLDFIENFKKELQK